MSVKNSTHIRNASEIVSDDFLITRPFGEDSKLLYSEWFAAYEAYHNIRRKKHNEEELISAVNAAFVSLTSHSTRHDQFLFEPNRPLYKTSIKIKKNRGNNQEKTRVYLVIKEMFEEVLAGHSGRQIVTGTKYNNIELPSPLFFLRRILTDGKYLASEAYAEAVIRAEIFDSAVRSFPPPKDINIYKFIADAINYRDVTDFIDTIASYQLKRDTTYLKTPTDFIVAHYLASKGLANLYLSATEQSKQPTRKSEKKKQSVAQLLEQRSIDLVQGYSYEIRLTKDVSTLPSVPQILNALEGIPVPLLGGSTLLAGGLRMTDRGGVVVKVSGQSGSGKTSLALATCAALAPLGVHTFYLSCEEENEDLLDRIQSVVPRFLKYTRTYKAPIIGEANSTESWFHAFHLKGKNPKDNFESAEDFADKLIEHYKLLQIEKHSNRPPGTVPYAIVLDGAHELIERGNSEHRDSFSSLHDLIEKYRALNVLVIIVSASIDEPVYKSMDYLVDVVIELDSVKSVTTSHKPVRTAELRKTRRQFSNAGTHRYHISKRDGIRFYPNLEATLEQFKPLKWLGVNKSRKVDFFPPVRIEKGKYEDHPLELFDRSQTLITGRGSSGKAGFAMKLMYSPVVSVSPTKKESTRLKPNISRFLIISFLYPESYYRGLEKKIFKDKRISSERIHTDVISFYPGFLNAEVMLTKITDKLRAGQAQGCPYNSVMIDGIHNVFLQFPDIQRQTIIWPMLSEIFRRLGMNEIITHAHLHVEGMSEDQHLAADVQSVAQRSNPMLQALVSSADYYMDVSSEKVKDEAGENLKIVYPIKVVTAFGQNVPLAPKMYWKRDELMIEYLLNRIEN